MHDSIHRQTLSDLLRRSARRAPDQLAVSCGEVSYTYAQFEDVCSRLANGLSTNCSVVKGSRIAVLARNSHGFAALRFALARLGAVLVPINFMLNAGEVRFIIEHSNAQVLATDSELADLARTAAKGTAVSTLVWLPSEGPTQPPADMITFGTLIAAAAQCPDVNVCSSDLAQVVYTSGTESAPKGAMLSHEALLWQYVSCLVDAEIASDDVLLHALPLYHCAQLDVFFGPGIYCGATNYITAKPTADNLLTLLERNGITSFFAPPTVWISLLRSPRFDRTDLTRLRKGYYGASIMPVEVLRELASRLPDVRLWNLYGQTEIAPLATILRPQDQLRKAGSAGHPVLNVETRVVDDKMQDMTPGQVGEVVHRSPQLMQGYFHDDERTCAAFEGGWFHSGDLATVDAEGFITIVDRKKDMIKSGGENVASREVEEAIYGLAGVSEVAVVGLPHPLWVEAVTAVVVCKQGVDLTEAELLAHCQARLAGFKVPKAVVFVDALPKNPSGKLLKRTLRQQYAELFS